jgi:2-C-methyl-D-erythritol 2,4-cyclodiphosphate synthase
MISVGGNIMRVGLGFDIHRLVESRKLVLGGVHIDYHKGLAAHSDGDVLVHAICDAVLGAAGLGDIGDHFPDNDAQYEGIDSTILLRRAVEMIHQSGLIVQGIDCVIMAEQPKILPHRAAIQEKLAEILQAEVGRISIKGKTYEGLGEIGRGEAIAAQVVAMLQQS